MKHAVRILISLIALSLVLLVGCKKSDSAPSPPPPTTKEEQKTETPLPYLPIGSIVRLGSTPQPVMVVGYAPNQIDAESPVLWDYSGCAYPEGILTPEELFMFNEEDITDVLYVGYTDSSFFELVPFIDQALNGDSPLLI